jgi:hypothetical protein
VALALLVTVFALFAPWLKTLGLASDPFGLLDAARFARAGVLGKLAMADIFLIALYITVAKGIGVGRIEPPGGFTCSPSASSPPWHSIASDRRISPPPGLATRRIGHIAEWQKALPVSPAPPAAPPSSAELDRRAGRRAGAGSAALVGGDPGIGKSTLLLQAAARFARRAPRLCLGRGGGGAGPDARARGWGWPTRR